MTREEALDILCKHLWEYEEYRVRERHYLDDEYFDARDMIVPEYKAKLPALQRWWKDEENGE